ncbi:hypothetical protein T12_16262 [Trichinella patagoniensis]|uniref:Uncharacterized protein n=1 Tax=Trichinella patagoniensis TaxID=990121 RepID=A0A0V0XDT1_9BILA|nr:hypothetical protein T12_16262 [Trichinella patagoniensis]
MASAAKSRSKKLVALKDRLNRLLAELDELCTSSADVFERSRSGSQMHSKPKWSWTWKEKNGKQR